MFKKKATSVEIEHRINIVNAEALNIKKTGSYILQLDTYLSSRQCEEILNTLKKDTGAKWIIVQGAGTKVITNV
jgi:hypothetical protein